MPLLLSSQPLPTPVDVWIIKLSDEEILSYDKNKPGDTVKIDRDSITPNHHLSAVLYFKGAMSVGAECTLIVTNENGKTITGTTNCDGKLGFFAHISCKNLLAIPEFFHANQLNISLDIKNAQNPVLNGVYTLGMIQLI
jgi:hypothetical protein